MYHNWDLALDRRCKNGVLSFSFVTLDDTSTPLMIMRTSIPYKMQNPGNPS